MRGARPPASCRTAVETASSTGASGKSVTTAIHSPATDARRAASSARIGGTVTDVLRWFHPVLKAKLLRRDRPQRVQVNGDAFALWRDAAGRACAVADACPHRF